MTTIVPQHMLALERANTIRLDRAQLRHRVHDVTTYGGSCREFAAVLLETPDCLASMRLEQGLRWVRSMGPARVQDCLVAAGCSPFKKIGDLTPRQLARVVETLEDWAYGRQAA